MVSIWKPQPKGVLIYWLDTILEEASDKLNSWETSFIDSIDFRVRSGQSLSQKQEEILERIYAKKT